MRATCMLSAALALTACGSSHSYPQASNTLAPTGDAAQAAPVDGISCETLEQLAFHLHAHLAIYVGDDQKLLAAGIGIGPPLDVEDNFVVGGSCFSWLHTHDQTGLIHIESPAPATGTVNAFVDGQPFTEDPSTIPLVTMGADGSYSAHGVLQLDVGTPVHPFEAYTFPPGY
jgi:hypothetical protein